MKEKIRVSMPTEVPAIDEEVDIDSIEQELNVYVKALIHRINIQDIEDWNLLILVISQSTNGIGISKRSIRYPSDKEYEIAISIAIPNDDEAPYGFSMVKEAFYIPLNDKYAYILEPNFENYHNLHQYILESSKRAIDFAFTQGFTCNGKKIKFQR